MRMVMGGARLWSGCLQAVHHPRWGEEERRGRQGLVPLPPRPALAGFSFTFSFENCMIGLC